MVGHTFEYNAAVWKLRELVGRRARPVHYLDSARLNLGLYQSDVNVIWDLAPHDVSIFNYVLGATPTWVEAWGSRHCTLLEDVAYIRLLYDEPNVTANIHVSWLDPCKVRRVTVVGSEKMAVYNDLATEERIRVYDKGVIRPRRDEPHRDADVVPVRRDPVSVRPFEEPLLVQDREFVACLATGQRPSTDGDSGARSSRRSNAPRSRCARDAGFTRRDLGAVVDSCRRPDDLVRTSVASVVPALRSRGDARELRPELDGVWASAVTTSAFIGGDSVAAFEDEWASACCATARRRRRERDGRDRARRSGRSGSARATRSWSRRTRSSRPPRPWSLGRRDPAVRRRRRTRRCCSTPAIVEEAISPRTAAVIVVHLYGNMPDMDELAAVADDPGIALIEDAAQAHGASWQGRPAGLVRRRGLLQLLPRKEPRRVRRRGRRRDGRPERRRPDPHRSPTTAAPRSPRTSTSSA